MDAKTRRTISMVKRVLAFETAHTSDDASQIAIVTKLQEIHSQLATLLETENAGRVEERAATNRRQRIRRDLKRQVRHLLMVVDIAAETDPDLAAHFVGPEAGAPNRQFYTVVRSLEALAREHEALLLTAGLGQTYLTDLTTNLEAFDAASAATDAGRGDHVDARSDLLAFTTKCIDLVRVLDGLNQARYIMTPERLRLWDSARNIYGPVGREGGAEEATPDAPAAGASESPAADQAAA